MVRTTACQPGYVEPPVVTLDHVRGPSTAPVINPAPPLRH
jgi:hypothetical protein